MTTSAADIVVPPPRPVSTFEGLRQLLGACGPDTNRHDRLTVLIAACIDAGFDTESGIIVAARAHGFKAGHAAILLREGIGIHWRSDGGGRYRNI